MLIDIRKNPERTAWIILATAFSLFCLLAMFIPASIYWYINTATEALPSELTSVRGIVLTGNTGTELTTSVTVGNTAPLEEGFAAATDNASQAIVTFADDSSLTLYGNTRIVLHQSQTPRFGIISNPDTILVEVQHGRVRATSSREQGNLAFEIVTPHASVQLDQGSYSIEANESGTQVTTRFGQAQVVNNYASVTLNQGQRAVADTEQISPPLPSAQNLLEDSNFNIDFESTWETYAITPIESVTTTVDVVIFQNEPILSLRSKGEDNVHSETGVIYHVNKDVRDFQSLRVFADVRLVDQTLPGGGQLGSEFPIMLHVAYKDINGNNRDWFHGFYYESPPENYILYNQPDNSSEQIARFLWYPYESVNLLTALGPAKPIYIDSIHIYASGWIYDAMVANISLLAEE